MQFSGLGVRAKLLAAFGVLLCLMICLGITAWMQLGRMEHQTSQIIKYRVAGVRDSGRMLAAATRVRVREYRLAVADVASYADATERYSRAVDDFGQARQDYASALFDDEEKRLYEASLKPWDAYLAAVDIVRNHARARQEEAAVQAALSNAKAFESAYQSILALTVYNDRGAVSDAEVSRSVFNEAKRVVAGLVCICLISSLVIAWRLSGSMRDRLARSAELAQSVASGDLAVKAHVDGHDEFGRLGHAQNTMVERLRTIVTDVREGVAAVATAAGEIAAGNADLSQRTEEQAANLEETAAAMEQLSATVQQNAHKARDAAEEAVSAATAASSGGASVAEVQRLMHEISARSARIADITGLIDGLAFQTNLLALNAAVEAARAGAQGRGFAVVASEVRTLAGRSGEAARQIRQLIDDAGAVIQQGAISADDAAHKVTDAVRRIGQVSELVRQIAAASQEQSQGIDQTGHALAQLDQVTQQNAALVEEASAAAQSLHVQSTRLERTVDVFKLPSA